MPENSTWDLIRALKG